MLLSTTRQGIEAAGTATYLAGASPRKPSPQPAGQPAVMAMPTSLIVVLMVGT